MTHAQAAGLMEYASLHDDVEPAACLRDAGLVALGLGHLVVEPTLKPGRAGCPKCADGEVCTRHDRDISSRLSCIVVRRQGDRWIVARGYGPSAVPLLGSWPSSDEAVQAGARALNTARDQYGVRPFAYVPVRFPLDGQKARDAEEVDVAVVFQPTSTFGSTARERRRAKRLANHTAEPVGFPPVGTRVRFDSVDRAKREEHDVHEDD